MKIHEAHLEVKRALSGTPQVESAARSIFDERVIMDAKRVYRLLQAWAGRYPVVLQRRLISMSLNCAAMCPNSNVRTLFQSAVVSLVIFAIDDLADGIIESLPDDRVHEILALCSDIAYDPETDRPDITSAMSGSDPPPPWLQTALAHREMCLDLLQGGPKQNYATFAEYFVDCMREMRTERDWRRSFIERREVPTFDEYMYTAERSIAAAVVWGALLPLDAYRLPPAIAGETFGPFKPLCDQIVFAGSRCIRLANDARSYDREIHFEQKPNSVLALIHHEKMSPEEAEAFVAARRESSQQEMLSLIAQLPPDLFEWGQCVRRFCDSIKNWYLMMEFHDAPERMKMIFAAVDGG